MKKIKRLSATVNWFLSCVVCATLLMGSYAKIYAQALTELHGQSPIFPDSATENNALYEALFDKLNEITPDVQLRKSHNNARRALRDIGAGRADFFFPVPCKGAGFADKNVRWGSERIGTVTFGVYSRKSDPVTRRDLSGARYKLDSDVWSLLAKVFSAEEILKLGDIQGVWDDKTEILAVLEERLDRNLTESERDHVFRASFPHLIETEMVGLPLFDLPVSADVSPSNSIKKLLRGRIDAYIYPVFAVENVIETMGASNLIARDFFVEYDICFMVNRSARGNAVDRILSNAFRALKETDPYNQIMGGTDEYERRWIERYSVEPPEISQ